MYYIIQIKESKFNSINFLLECIFNSKICTPNSASHICSLNFLQCITFIKYSFLLKNIILYVEKIFLHKLNSQHWNIWSRSNSKLCRVGLTWDSTFSILNLKLLFIHEERSFGIQINFKLPWTEVVRNY